MSRLRKLIAPEELWLRGLRAVLRRVQREDATVLVGEKTAGADFIRRGCERLGISCRLVERVAEADVPHQNAPPIPSDDRAIVANADRIFVLGLRLQGNQHCLLRERLRISPANVILVALPDLQPAPAKDELVAAGAQLWSPTEDECRPFDSAGQSKACSPSAAISRSQVFRIAPCPDANESEWLFHTTRSCPGPWPGSPHSEYLDSLLDQAEDANHSPLHALMRIARQRCLTASDSAIRGKHKVVCFSGCSLEELSALHRFRRHRMRWDFEPYGIGIRRGWLTAQGVRPVVHGDDDLWQSLPDSDRPYFQFLATGSDWTAEREWRHLGDLRLNSLTNDDAILIVPTYDEAKLLIDVTEWPVTLWPNEKFIDS